MIEFMVIKFNRESTVARRFDRIMKVQQMQMAIDVVLQIEIAKV